LLSLSSERFQNARSEAPVPVPAQDKLKAALDTIKSMINELK
jgi:hypothetical protein